MHCYAALSSMYILINAYEDVYQLFTAKKAGQLRIRYVCILLCFKSLYCTVWLLISWGSNFRGFH